MNAAPKFTVVHRKHRRWLVGVVIVAFIAVPFMPALTMYFGMTILALCIGSFVQTGANGIRLNDRMNGNKLSGRIGSRFLVILPIVENISRRLLRLDSAETWRRHLRLVMYGLIGILLVVAGQTGANSVAERQVLAAKKAGEELENQRIASEANATVASLAQDAETAMKSEQLSVAEQKLAAAINTPNATDLDKVRRLRTQLANMKVEDLLAKAIDALHSGDIEAARQRTQDACSVPYANAAAEVNKLQQQINTATDPGRIREVLLEISDNAFEELRANGAMPMELRSGYSALDNRSAEIAMAAIDDIAKERESRRLAQLEAEKQRKAELKLAADASARKAKAGRDNEVSDASATSTSEKRNEERPIRRGSQAYLEVKGENVVWVSIDKKAMSELNAFSSAKNEEGISQMMQVGRVLVCSKGTKVSVIDPGFLSTTIRIMEGKHAGMTGIIANEFLHSQSGTPAEDLAARSTSIDPDSVTVRSRKLVDFVSPANGKTMQMLMVTLKNSGSTSIRVVDADITWRDASGTIIGTRNYTIFAESDSSPGISPGNSWTTRKGDGFLLLNPVGLDGTTAKAKSVKVEITKVLERSGM